MSEPGSRPIEIVLTGGPCAGKTTALARLSAKLADWGFRVLLVPEVATMLISGGLSDIGAIAADPARFFVIEGEFLRFQRALREWYRSPALAPEKVVIIYDRGESDVVAYIGPEVFGALLALQHLNAADVRDSYDVVST